MSKLMLYELVDYCAENSIDSFMFTSSDQKGDRYFKVYLELKQLSLFVDDPMGRIILYNETSVINLHDVKYVNIIQILPEFGVSFDIVCGGENNNIHRVVGKYKHQGVNSI